jgi:osmotically-inducible protein OsmY
MAPRHDTTPPHRPSPLDGPPALGNGAERFDADGTGLGGDHGPESQGRRSGEGFGLGGQGEYGDENYDPADQRIEDTAGGVQIERVGPGRGTSGRTVVVEPSTRTGTAPAARPDDGLREEILEMLDDADVVDTADLAIDVHDGQVTLQGTVDDDATREAVESYVADVDGVRAVENLLAVRDPEA